MEQFNIGQKVHYSPKVGTKENGIIKSFNDDKTMAFVVYKLNGPNYNNYPGQLTRVEDLKDGWIF